MLILPDIKAGAIVVDRDRSRSPPGRARAKDDRRSITMAACHSSSWPLFRSRDVAAPDCFLLLWIPLRSVFLVEPLMRAWGFAFSGAGFTLG